MSADASAAMENDFHSAAFSSDAFSSDPQRSHSFARLSPDSSSSSLGATDSPEHPEPGTAVRVVFVLLYAIICVGGLVGNGLVIFVVSRYSNMKTVANKFILNLSLADGVFILGLPMIITTSIVRQWLFGSVLCKIYYILTCVNMFTGSFTLAIMSADRFLAVYFPLRSKLYRTPRNATYVIIVAWALSFVAMTPIVVFANSVPAPGRIGYYSCTIEWPVDKTSTAMKIYIVYTFLLGFVVPAFVISLLYSLLVLKLRSNAVRCQRMKKRVVVGQGGTRRPPRRNITRLVFLIVVVYAVCWSPYWAFQVYLISGPRRSLASWEVLIFQLFTVLSYANSAINPILYAFTNDQFRNSFVIAFRCCRPPVGRGRSGATGAGVATPVGAPQMALPATESIAMRRQSFSRVEAPDKRARVEAKTVTLLESVIPDEGEENEH